MTEYLRDSWYCIGWSSQLEEKPIGITVCGTYIVAYRGADGSIIAMDGRCPHRFAPMKLGSVNGDTIACPYHGLVFDRDGTCILNPHGGGAIPPNATLKAYPAVEHLGAIWVWLGTAEHADRSKLPMLEWWGSSDYAVSTGYLRVEAHYQLVMDNLLDLTHGPYLHADTLGGDPANTVGVGMRHEWDTQPGPVLHSNYFVENMPSPSPQIMALVGDIPGRLQARMRWRPASILDLDLRYSPAGGGADAHIPSVHYLAPESDNSTHYFFALARNVDITNETLTEMLAAQVHKAFAEEDEPMIKACQSLMGTSDLMSMKPAILQTDAAAIQARRLLKKEMA